MEYSNFSTRIGKIQKIWRGSTPIPSRVTVELYNNPNLSPCGEGYEEVMDRLATYLTSEDFVPEGDIQFTWKISNENKE